MWKWSWLIISLLLLAEPAIASDLVREQRNAYEIRKNLVAGKVIDLKAGEQEFLAIHGESEIRGIKGAVILLHGMGSNPAWAAVVQPLRTGLTGHGWESLSLQMPLAPLGVASAAYQPLIPEAAPRIAAAIEFLKQRKIDKIVIIGHSLGARMGLETLAAGLPKEVIALVAIGTPTRADAPDAGVIGALKKIKLPLLDIFGSRDLPSVLGGSKARSLAARQAENSGYQQVEIVGADHFFRGVEDSLLARVRSWIGRQAAEAVVVSEQDAVTDKPAR
jgi:pimeloyl-ACP methyl ester carboxylesterase